MSALPPRTPARHRPQLTEPFEQAQQGQALKAALAPAKAMCTTTACLETINHMATASMPPPLDICNATERATLSPLIECGEERLHRPPSPLLRAHTHGCCTRVRRRP